MSRAILSSVAPVVLLAIAACASEPATSPALLGYLAPVEAKAPGGWAHMASGGGQDLYPGSTKSDFQISFTAREDAAGSDQGTVTWTDPSDGGIITKGKVDCLYVSGNRAWIRYVTDLDGTSFHIYVGFEDNGEGARAPRDRHTFIYGGPVHPANATCEDFASSNGFGGGFPVEWIRGNVQVR